MKLARCTEIRGRGHLWGAWRTCLCLCKAAHRFRVQAIAAADTNPGRNIRNELKCSFMGGT